jgi:hypothetical protein
MEDLPLSGLLLVGLLGAGVVFCCWCIQWSLAVMEATCFSSSQIQFVLVACEESIAFSICSTCRDSCRISWWSESVRATPKLGFWAVVSAGGIAVCFCNVVFEGVCKPEGPGGGVDHWEVGGGDPTESEALKPKESRGY